MVDLDARRWIWAWASGWLTPTGLFVLLNLVIGTIAVTHRRRDRPAAAAAERPLSRTSSAFVLDRLRSFGLCRFRSGDFPPDYYTPAEPVPDPVAENLEERGHHFGRSRSESRAPAAAEAEGEGAGRMKKSASASSAFAKFEEGRVARLRAAAEEEEEVNARADDFINRFRQQLQLQRLNSLLNYKEMLNRGST